MNGYGLRTRDYIIYPGSSITGRISPDVDSKKRADFAKLFTLKTTRKVEGLHFSRHDNAKWLVKDNLMKFQ